MTNQTHTELAAQARRAVKSLEILDMENTAELMRQCAAALESPERVQGEAITTDELRLFAHTLEQFEDCNETDTPYETLMKWANRGWLECERFISTAEGNRVLEGIAPPLFAASDLPTASAQDAQGVHNEYCACSQWVITYAHDLKRGEHHHRDCKKWHRVIGSAIITKTEFMVLGDPGDDEDHDCDAMGCSSVSHVLVRLPLAALRASSPAEPTINLKGHEFKPSDLLRRGVLNLRKGRSEFFWAVVSKSFGLGSTCSAALAAWAGRDPDTGIVTKEST